MSTGRLIHHHQAAPTSAASAWPRDAVVAGTDGVPVTGVTIDGPPRDRHLALAMVEDPSALLTHRFGRGGRRVALVFEDGALLHGSLETCWQDGRRAWWLDLEG